MRNPRLLCVAWLSLWGSGCVSFVGQEPRPIQEGMLPLAEPLCTSYEFYYALSTNDDEGPLGKVSRLHQPVDFYQPATPDQEDLRLIAVDSMMPIHQALLSAGVMGFDAPARVLRIELVENYDFSTPLSWLSLATLFTVPLWAEIELRVTATLLDEAGHPGDSYTETASYHGVVQTLMLAALPFYDQVNPAHLVAQATDAAIARLVAAQPDR